MRADASIAVSARIPSRREMLSLPEEVALGVEPRHVQPCGRAELLELLVVDGDVGVSIILDRSGIVWSATARLRLLRESRTSMPGRAEPRI